MAKAKKKIDSVKKEDFIASLESLQCTNPQDNDVYTLYKNFDKHRNELRNMLRESPDAFTKAYFHFCKMQKSLSDCIN